MRNTVFFIVCIIGLLMNSGCVTDAKKEVANEVSATGANAEAKAAWKERAKAAQAKNQKAARPNRPATGKQVNSGILAKYKQPVTTEKNKGVFITEAPKYLGLTPAKTTELNTLIKKYKRKGLDFKFFGAFYSNQKPFARDINKILTPLQVEKFKHFHAYWFDRIPYPRPDMPVSLYYRLNLTKDQFVKVIDVYSATSLAKAKGNTTAAAGGVRKIDALLNPTQKGIYKEILSVSTETF